MRWIGLLYATLNDVPQAFLVGTVAHHLCPTTKTAARVGQQVRKLRTRKTYTRSPMRSYLRLISKLSQSKASSKHLREETEPFLKVSYLPLLPHKSIHELTRAFGDCWMQVLQRCGVERPGPRSASFGMDHRITATYERRRRRVHVSTFPHRSLGEPRRAQHPFDAIRVTDRDLVRTYANDTICRP